METKIFGFVLESVQLWPSRPDACVHPQPGIAGGSTALAAPPSMHWLPPFSLLLLATLLAILKSLNWFLSAWFCLNHYKQCLRTLLLSSLYTARGNPFTINCQAYLLLMWLEEANIEVCLNQRFNVSPLCKSCKSSWCWFNWASVMLGVRFTSSGKLAFNGQSIYFCV